LPSATEPAPTAAVVADHAGLPLPTDRGEFFSGSGGCATCHTQTVDEAGVDVSVDASWRASMMANAAFDPYWQATVRSEVLTNPALGAVIEDKCAACHMPMASFTSVSADGAGVVLDDGFTDPGHELHGLAMDGVSCTLCHQIRDEGLGEESSFGGGYVIDTELPAGERESYGPYAVEADLAEVMQVGSGFVPVESAHIQKSALCATCHTLYTPYVDAAGEVAGVFPEQTAFFEWMASAYGGSTACQDCHMPAADGGVQLSVTGGPLREPFSQHRFVGGNAFMLSILERFGDELGVTSSSAQFRDKQAQVVEQLQERTGSVSVKEAGVDGSTLSTTVAVGTMAGHKLPTGFPSRRAWLHLTVEDANGEVVFESGAVNPDGSITGNDNDDQAGAFEPHYLAIDSEDQVQIYESIMGDTEDMVTTVLLHGAGYLKDNRLLPPGFDKDTVMADIAVHGKALEDQDFAGGGDQVQYEIDIGDAAGPFTVTVDLLYQSIGYRWAENMRGHDAPEPDRFVSYYEQVSNQPIVVASDTINTGE
jgi:hypothetical protein